MNRRERAVVLLLTGALLIGAGISYWRRARLSRHASAVPMAVLEDAAAVQVADSYVVPRPVDINLATARQMDALPGIGPVLASRIVEYRQQKGGFRSVSELRAVPGIGDKRYQTLKELVTVESSGAADSGR